MIDRVTVKGSTLPLDLYTVDIFSYPAHFGKDTEEPGQVLDAEFEGDPFVEHTQVNAPEGTRLCCEMCETDASRASSDFFTL